ncbi:unnamed protein product [Cylicocyclus nassatus]|uniref:Uncharacterized protein n=1 Tax=Cylicocyclus nassatus TaxID=53992 RepID=A0AA36GVU6_CYLNA|nr:unnamed protein product [Cylicocyclus nassatus]
MDAYCGDCEEPYSKTCGNFCVNGRLVAGTDMRTKMLFVSHGETVAEVFPQWLRLAYRGGGEVYQPYDLNMPAVIPRRPAEHFKNDPPLTEHGNFTAEFIGKGMKLAGYNPSVIFSSPELRCVQTAAGIARAAADSQSVICLEPALSDWVQLSPEESWRTWIKPAQYASLGYPINLRYRSFIDKLLPRESPEDYLRRVSLFLSKISRTSERVIVIVGNPHVIAVARNNPWSTAEQICQIKQLIRNCVTCEVGVDSENRVHKVAPMMLPFTKTLREATEKIMASQN